MSLITRILRNKWYPPAEHDTISFASKTILITGSNTGLGAVAAQKFAAQGAARLILAVRNEQKARSTQRICQHLASDPNCQVEVWHLDLLNYDSIRAFATRCEKELSRLDIAVLNAGVYSAAYRQSKYGWEETLQVNTLSTSLLALLVLPKLRASKNKDCTPILEFVNSGRHYAVSLSEPERHDASVNVLSEYSKQDTFISGKLYRASKLFLMCFAKVLATKVRPNADKPPDVYVVSVCPGACQSELSREMDSIPLQMVKIFAGLLFLRTPEEGSRIIISGTAQGERAHGEFWQNDVVRDAAPALQGDEGEMLCEKVYTEIVQALRRDMPDLLDLSPG